jgi:hypothetical protein
MEIETRQLPSPSPPMQFKTVAFAIAPGSPIKESGRDASRRAIRPHTEGE